MKDALNYENIVKSVVGEEIQSISNSQYFFNGERCDDDLGDVEIQTSLGFKVCFNLLGDGESVGAYQGELNVPEAFDVTGGGWASWQKLPLEMSSTVVGKRIAKIEAMYVEYQRHGLRLLSGWRVTLSGGHYFVFYNCGDNARILLNEVPSDLLEGAVTTWKSI